MKHILAIGIVLLVLLALTGVVSAADTATADVQVDVNFPHDSIDLTITYLDSGWTLGLGENELKGIPGQGIYWGINTVGYDHGVSINVADNLDDGKPEGTAGKMVAYNPSLAQHYSSNKVLTNPIQIVYGPQGLYNDVTGSPTPFFIMAGGFHSAEGNAWLKQIIDESDSNARYRIVLTFTAIPN